MAISPENKSLNTDSGSVALLVVRTKNIINEGYLPEIQFVEILDRNSKKTINFDCTNSIFHPTEAYLVPERKPLFLILQKKIGLEFLPAWKKFQKI